MIRLGYGSLKEYCLKELHFSEERTYALIAIVNASLRVPEVSTLIQEGKLSISNARRIAKRIEPENKEIWLEKATTLSQHQLEKEIAKAFPEARVKERIRPIAENLSSLLRAAERAAKSPARAEKSTALNARTLHEVMLRDRGQCTHLDPSGQRCTNRTFLHIHHITPRHLGGSNEVDNLTTHCSTHHRFHHQNDAYQGPSMAPVTRSTEKNKKIRSQENAAWKKVPINLLQTGEAKLQTKLEAGPSR